MTREGRPSNLAASIRDRLLNKARTEQLDFNLLLTRYALERLIYRLSISEHRDQFLLKGALLFDLWFDIPHRPTHDADFLGLGLAEIPHLENVFRGISRIDGEDGILFQPDSVKAVEIRKEANYAGIRVMLLGLLGNARCTVQVDVGLAMPISWKGTLQQYAGRLHREHATKTDVRIVDFVDMGHPALLRMWDKRQRGYRAMGYRMGASSTLSG